MSADLDAAIRQAEEALAKYDGMSPMGQSLSAVVAVALRALLDAARGSGEGYLCTKCRRVVAAPLHDGCNYLAGRMPIPDPAPAPLPPAVAAFLRRHAERGCLPSVSCREEMPTGRAFWCDACEAAALLDAKPAPDPLLAASRYALAVLTDLAESAAYWTTADVPVGLLPRVDEAKARLAAALGERP